MILVSELRSLRVDRLNFLGGEQLIFLCYICLVSVKQFKLINVKIK